MIPPVRLGDVIQVAEPDYLYGRGPLHLRVTGIGTVEQHDDGPWLPLRGVELYADGREKTGQPRQALVGLQALVARPKLPEAKA